MKVVCKSINGVLYNGYRTGDTRWQVAYAINDTNHKICVFYRKCFADDLIEMMSHKEFMKRLKTKASDHISTSMPITCKTRKEAKEVKQRIIESFSRCVAKAKYAPTQKLNKTKITHIKKQYVMDGNA